MLLAGIEMTLVADMQDVEHAMRQHDLLAARARRGGDRAQLVESPDLARHRLHCSRLAPR